MEHEFEWDQGNREHFAHRGIEAWEAEQVVVADDRVALGGGTYRGERRFSVLGSTEDGRLLVVVYTRRDGRIRIVTARAPTNREARLYRRRR